MSKLDFIKKLYNGKNCYSDHMNKDELGFLHISSGVEPLVSDMLDKHKLVFLTGNPGDGKTFIIKAIEPCIIRNNVFVKTDFNEVTNYADAARNMLMVTDSDTIRMQGLYISEDELDNFVKSRQ